MSHLMDTYARQGVAFTHGQGVWLTDKAGNAYRYARSLRALDIKQHTPAS